MLTEKTLCIFNAFRCEPIGEKTFSYPVQISDTCTIYNLKKALQLALKLQDSHYHDLEASLTLLLDSWISSWGMEKKIVLKKVV